MARRKCTGAKHATEVMGSLTSLRRNKNLDGGGATATCQPVLPLNPPGGEGGSCFGRARVAWFRKRCNYRSAMHTAPCMAHSLLPGVGLWESRSGRPVAQLGRARDVVPKVEGSNPSGVATSTFQILGQERAARMSLNAREDLECEAGGSPTTPLMPRSRAGIHVQGFCGDSVLVPSREVKIGQRDIRIRRLGAKERLSRRPADSPTRWESKHCA